MSIETVLYLVGVFWIGWFICSQVKTIRGISKVQKARDSQYGELKKLYDLTNRKMRVSTFELTDLVKWVNEELPEDITLLVLSNPKLTILKNKGGIPDIEYMEAFEDVILGIQSEVAEKFQGAFDRINKQFLEDLKGLTNDVQEK
jgi:hypothetical protein